MGGIFFSTNNNQNKIMDYIDIYRLKRFTENNKLRESNWNEFARQARMDVLRAMLRGDITDINYSQD